MLKKKGKHIGFRGLLLTLALLLSACQVELFGGLREQEANEIIALLQRHGISVTKTVGKKQVVALAIDEAEFSTAITLLKKAGLPRERFADLGEVFKKEGMVSSPTEERARFLYARSQELSQTLSQIDGALSARVHVVLPEKKTPTSSGQPASASVFIQHADMIDFAPYVPKIKSLVSNAIEGLSYEKVTVALFPVRFREDGIEQRVEVWGTMMPAENAGEIRQMLTFSFLAGVALLILLGGAGFLVWWKVWLPRQRSEAGEAAA